MDLDTIAKDDNLLRFGIELGGVNGIFAPVINVLMESSPWPITLRREYCKKGGFVEQAQKRAKDMLTKIENDYSELPTAEKYKAIINERLAQLTELASRYNN
jgi:hypothetical protein